ncbi:Major facilitator superfamily domain, general substrate transporter [Metarhizium album ARSEF 1941]|uniref:Major facilitator superfamily domain, general substrate transporter n=1 Tax=Metarhizium album (strain ARSEF 1941) TaxID=1081103 RepID=A0A0B2WMI7_METAS|nr:Major facilitator superfamily domain, general substrate transporter [Metarhizium album ARSEF 1941]KHN94702.1 Major facilitator superfamily domain, general substrate transporter [Metarhizium album ARSEF 1941]
MHNTAPGASEVNMAPASEKPPTRPGSSASDPDAGDEPGPGRHTAAADGAHLDTWRGWLVVAAASTSLFMYMGVIYSWGVLQARMADARGYSLTTLTFVGSLATSFMVSLCILVGKLVRKFGYTRPALVGAVLLGLGEFLSSWAVGHLWALFLTHGILFGIGGGLTILPCSTAPLQWFRKYRGLATGIVFGGGSLGAAVMGVASSELVNKVGIEWTFRILGFMLWALCLPAAYCIKQPLLSKSCVPQLQWYRWREPKFILLLVGGAIACFPLFVPPYFIPIFARSVGNSGSSSSSSSGSTAVVALTIWNLASTLGRVFAGYSADSFLGPLNSLTISLLLCGASALAMWPFVTNMGLLVSFTIINGIGCGSFFSLFPLAVETTFGSLNTMGILPILWQAWIFGYFLGTPIAARLYSAAGTGTDVSLYRPAAYYAGTASFVGMLFMLAVRLMNSRKVFAKA